MLKNRVSISRSLLTRHAPRGKDAQNRVSISRRLLGLTEFSYSSLKKWSSFTPIPNNLLLEKFYSTIIVDHNSTIKVDHAILQDLKSSHESRAPWSIRLGKGWSFLSWLESQVHFGGVMQLSLALRHRYKIRAMKIIRLQKIEN